MDKPKPEIKAKINFIYQSCNDLEAMRHFYTELIGMHQAHYKEGSQGWLVYMCEGFQFMIFPSSYELPVRDKFGMQPGWEGGELEVMSWSLIVPEEDFAATVQRLRDAGVRSAHEQPTWQQDSYWSFPVLDPMGNTVELHTIPAERPASLDWPG